MPEQKKNKKCLFIFRRDLRLEDNTGLICALNESDSVVASFIFDPRQTDKKKNSYFSEHAFAFLIESLRDLDNELKSKKSHLYIFEGIAHDVLLDLIKKENIDSVYINKDYTPFSKNRDLSIKKICYENKINFKEFPDALLNEPEQTLKSDGNPYTIFTPYWKNASRIPIKNPQKNKLDNYYNKKINFEKSIPDYNSSQSFFGGRKNALLILNKVSQLENYENMKDFPALSGTSNLSAHLKFGTISAREVYSYIANSFSTSHPLLRQLYWRDFFYHIAYNFPKVFGSAFQDKYSKLLWNDDKKLFEAWKIGMTGFPIIDAGMRELNSTGYMHNRVRMIVASFLTKDLHIDWRLGEKYFAQTLKDYDPCINNGNWQWAASTGCDAQPYFRIFNPWTQQEKFDPECKYIKKWVPELINYSPKQIHNIAKEPVKNYPAPIVVHSSESKIAIERYKNL